MIISFCALNGFVCANIMHSAKMAIVNFVFMVYCF